MSLGHSHFLNVYRALKSVQNDLDNEERVVLGLSLAYKSTDINHILSSLELETTCSARVLNSAHGWLYYAIIIYIFNWHTRKQNCGVINLQNSLSKCT